MQRRGAAAARASIAAIGGNQRQLTHRPSPPRRLLARLNNMLSLLTGTVENKSAKTLTKEN